jgi:RimJ/RimL family protein N-acetyltransferase
VNDDELHELHEMRNDRDLSGIYVDFSPMSFVDFQDFVKNGTATWFFIEKTQDESTTKIGWINYFWTRTDKPYLFELGYAIEPKERGKGYATEAVRQIVSMLFSTASIERIEALTDTENVASQRVLEKNGFKREGELRKLTLKDGQYRNEFIYGFIREDWENLR